MQKSIVLCSGGLNSAVLVALAKEAGPIALLHVRYPHQAAARETAMFEKLAAHFDVADRLVVDLPHFGEIGGNARVEDRIDLEDAIAIKCAPSTCFVAGLMPTLIGVAFTWAERLESAQIWVGVSENLGRPGPMTSAAYPDYSREFLTTFEQALALASARPPIRIETPLIDLDRADIIRLGRQFEVPFKWTWSCLASGETPCQRCLGCATRVRGFIAAGQPDPVLLPAAAKGT